MSKIKILSIYRSKLNENRGTPIRVRSILTELEKNSDFEVHTCSWDKKRDSSTGHLYLSNNHFDDLKKIYNYIKKNGIYIVIGHTLATSYYLFPLKFLVKAKIVLEMHGFIEEEAKLYKSINLFNYLKNKFFYTIFYISCDLITTCSETATKIISKYNKNTITIFGGVDTELFNPNIESGYYIKKEEENEIIIGYAGNTRVWQGLDFLIEAFTELIKEHPGFRLALVTSDKKREESLSSIKNIGPLEYKNISKFLIDCDILVIPRLDNKVNKISFPSKLPEYMAMGKAIVASRTSDMDKILIDGENGLLYEPGDKIAFKKAIVRLKDPVIRDFLGGKALKTVEDSLTWEKQTKIITNRLKKLI